MSSDFRRTKHLFTSESVSMGHPDKVADQISDAVLDSIIAVDPYARVACETLVTTGLVVLAGEVTVHNEKAAAALANVEETARLAIKEIGYNDPAIGFDYRSCAVIKALHGQSADISRGVTKAADAKKKKKTGAGDQGLMFGYACDETDVYMPLPIHLSHRIVERLAELRESGDYDWLRPDAKSQVTIAYENEQPVGIDTIVVSTQHDESALNKQGVFSDEHRDLVIQDAIRPVIPAHLWNDSIKFWINPTGRFIIGGPHGDTGLTGRKIIVDSYGGRGAHGGGAFSGKDPTKVDRSACYMARYIAKNLVAAGVAKSAEVQLAYAIGVADPVSVSVSTEGTSVIGEDEIADIVRDVFPLDPDGIIEHLDLRRPIFKETARHGHFGRLPGKGGTFSWEKLDQVDALRKAAKIGSPAKAGKRKKG
ncbi:MAG: metK [Phycisphaerales bacterium]|nr:metK [Phycisphaerales bacterium]